MKTTKRPTKATKTVKAAPKQDAANKDKFGTRIGTNCAKINACIGETAKDAGAITAESKQKPGLVQSHLRTLLQRGAVKKVEGGFIAAKK